MNNGGAAGLRAPAVQPGRYDADQMVTAFAARLQDAVDPDAVRADLAGAVIPLLSRLTFRSDSADDTMGT